MGDQKKRKKQWGIKRNKETMGRSKEAIETMGGSKRNERNNKRKKQWENEKNNEDNVRNNSNCNNLFR